jgi:hypothetical protein
MGLHQKNPLEKPGHNQHGPLRIIIMVRARVAQFFTRRYIEVRVEKP